MCPYTDNFALHALRTLFISDHQLQRSIFGWLSRKLKMSGQTKRTEYFKKSSLCYVHLKQTSIFNAKHVTI